MTEPKRWSSPSSDVDPVLRSVLLYARDVQPDATQLQAILRGSADRRARPRRRRFSAFVAAAAIVAGAGVAWAGYATRLLFDSKRLAPRAVTAASARAQATSAAPKAALALPSASAAAQLSPSAAAVPRVVPSAPPSEPRVAPEQEAALLQEARRVVLTEPGRALTLTRDHELHFPSSALGEERQALRIEALARLGRSAEAARELSSFDRHFPRSIYGRRLHGILPD